MLWEEEPPVGKVVGTPEMTPVVLLSARPAGRVSAAHVAEEVTPEKKVDKSSV